MIQLPIIYARRLEVFGLTAVEAAAEGGILIASAIGGIVDAVIYGVSGFLRPSEDVEAWIEQINTIYHWESETRIDFIKNAISSVDKHCSWENVALKTFDLYQLKP